MSGELKWKRPPVVLVADDSMVNRKIMETLLQNCGCTVITADNGQQALRQFTTDAPDLIFMDVNMPAMDGLEAARQVREMEKQRQPPTHIPIVALTGGAMPDEQRQCHRAGMSIVSIKPLSIKNLNLILTQQLSTLLN